jgi:hypothetical protein
LVTKCWSYIPLPSIRPAAGNWPNGKPNS